MSFEILEPHTPGIPESLMMETDPTIVDAQIETLVAEAGSVFGVINNFTENLPGGHFRMLVDGLGYLDVPLVQGPSRREWYPHSDRALTGTWRQFFADVDAAIDVAGLDRQELGRLSEAMNQPSLDRGEAHEAYCRYSLPVYRELRILGYSHFDLIR